MHKCKVCNSTKFSIEAGYYFCEICQTQNEDIRDEVLELHYDHSTRVQKTKIRPVKSDKSGGEVGWTSWELYNFVLIGLVDELIQLGVTSNIKLTVLQLWATYLKKVEIAFFSTKQKCVPKLAKRYNKRDATIIYGKLKAQKKKKRRKSLISSTNLSAVSSFPSEVSSTKDVRKSKRLMVSAEYDRYLQSQSSSNDATSLVSSGVSSEQSLENTRSIKFSTHAKEETKRVKAISLKLPKNKRSKFRKVHLTSKYKTGPYIITMSKLWAIIYLALRYHNEPMQLGDMIRYGREGHLSYYRLDHLLPAEINLTKTDINFLSRNYEMTHKGMRHTIAEMAKFLGVYELSPPNLLSLITRYCTELQLPRGVLLYAERLLVLTSPKMTFDSKKSLFPNYEGRVMAFIIVILKLIFSLDGITEYKISQTIANINRADTNSLESKLFNFYEWQCYIECRKAILTNIHLPTKLKYYPDSLDIKSLYIQFLKSINLKNNRPVSEQTDTKHHIPHDLANLLHQCVKQLNESDLPSSNKYCLVPSTTPMHSYMQQVLVDSFEYPIILQNNFFVSKVGYATKSEFLQKIAEYSSITLKTIDSNLHFVEKVVPFFEKTKMLTANELKEGIELKINTLKTKSPVKETETLIDYNNKKIPCLIKIDKSKQIYFDYMQQYTEKPQRCDLSSLEDFEFESVLPNGKLIIPSDPEWDSESDENEQIDSLSDVNTKYNLHLSSWEEKLMDSSSSLNTRKDEILRPKPLRDNLGRFLKSKAEKKKSKAYRSILNAKNKYANEAESFDEPDLKTYNKLLLDKHKNINNIKPDDSILFRPYTQYWMYHCIFSKVKPKNFDLFQRSLPITFRWLLMECAKTIEMSTEDLYEEVCLLEAYLVHVLKPRPSANSDISSTQVRSNIKSEQNIAIRSKW